MDQASGLREMLAKESRQRSPIRIVAVTSGKGGVGKTNISSNLAVLAARSGQRVLILDADLGLANVEILYGITPRYHLGHLLAGTVPVHEVFSEGPHGIRVISASSGVHELTHLDDAQKLRLITALDEYEDDFDLVLIDTSAGIGDAVRFFTAAAQEVILVVSPEPTSLTDAYATVKVLSQEAGVQHFNVVVNPAPGERAARDIFQKLTSVTNRFISAKVMFLGFIPRDENLQRAIMVQKPVVDLFPRSPSSRALAAIADKLLKERPPVNLDGGLKLLWRRLLSESATA